MKANKPTIEEILPDPLILKIAKRAKQTTEKGIAQACILHLAETNEKELIENKLTLAKLTNHIKKKAITIRVKAIESKK